MSILKEVLEETYLQKGSEKLKQIIAAEKDIQRQWNEQKVFEVDASSNDDHPKYMATFPYPYMNGRLHVGHLFTISKTCFAVKYHRLKGEHALFPFGFHCTGMPIKACADKLRDELERFGPTGPPHMSEEEHKAAIEDVKSSLVDAIKSKGEKKDKQQNTGNKQQKKKTGEDPTKFKSNKSKAQAKKGTGSTQWEIMRTLGMSDEEIAKFAESLHWLDYFPAHCREDLDALGIGVDWRRSFITTDINPYYDSFVRWQFQTLNDRNRLEYGKRLAIYSPKDGQACMDHDRRTGEGVGVTEFILIKMELQKPFTIESLKPLEETYKVYLVPATLRPETMYAQTNCWILPNVEYGVFKVNDKEAFVCTERAARNMAFQDLSAEFGKVERLATVKSNDLIGTLVSAPLRDVCVRVLPMETISMKKGTGIVTSVPSDSPDDLAVLTYLKQKEKIRNDFGVKEEWVKDLEPIPMMETNLGTLTAVAVNEKYKVQSPKDANKLALAKDEAYKAGFYQGVMIVGEYAGKPVKDVKDKIAQGMLERGEAVKYAEPENEVISRSGDECVAAATAQWFLRYGDEDWKALARQGLNQMNTYCEDTRHGFAETIERLHEWPCARMFGLGSRLPCDETWLIESLSDSTIYMAYYTIAHILQSDLFGKEPGLGKISADQMTREVYDYIFLGAPLPANSTIPKETLEWMRKEFRYWYPMDMRASGKDLVPNHLTFCLFNHAAIWPEEPNLWPVSMRSNGHMRLNNAKMSKQTGNFLTIADCVDLFGADATRYTLAVAGDSVDDANFQSDVANKAVLKLYTALEKVKEFIEDESKTEDRPTDSCFFDESFHNQINLCIVTADEQYLQCNFRSATLTAFGLMNDALKVYLLQLGDRLPNRKLIRIFFEAQALMMVPITPHWSERVWKILGKSGFAVTSKWPEAGAVHDSLAKMHTYIHKMIDKWKKAIGSKKVTTGTVYVAVSYPEWQRKTYEMAKTGLLRAIPAMKKEIASEMKTQIPGKDMKLAGFTLTEIMNTVESFAQGLQCQTFFDEVHALEQHKEYIEKCLGISLEITTKSIGPKARAVPVPYDPVLVI